jgi:uncharacterized protein YdeI (BOF family)
MSHHVRTILTITMVTAFSAALAVPALAQDEETATTTISAIERGETEANVYLQGAALEQIDDDEFMFSDGTGVIKIDVDDDAGEGELPLFELIGIEGTLASNEIDISRWALLPIMTPAVIVEEPQVIEAFWGWIIAYGSQAPIPDVD